MALYACILAQTEPGYALKIARSLREHRGVGLVVPTAGPYDLLVVIEGENATQLGETVVEKFQTIEGVVSTLTLVALKDVDIVNWLHDRVAGTSSTQGS